MLLDKSTRKLQITVDTAISVNSLAVTAQYLDEIREAAKPETVFTSAGVGTTDILETPADVTARHVIELHICNIDNVAHNVTILINHETVSQVIKLAGLNPGDTLHYNEYHGWGITGNSADNSGAIRNYRKVTNNFTVTIFDDIIDVDATAGAITGIFNPAIVPLNKVKEVKISKIDGTTNGVSISDGTSIIAILSSLDSYDMYAKNDGSGPVLEIS